MISTLIVPALRVGMPPRTLCVQGDAERRSLLTTQSVGTIDNYWGVVPLVGTSDAVLCHAVYFAFPSCGL
jgi:hypothetical protein